VPQCSDVVGMGPAQARKSPVFKSAIFTGRPQRHKLLNRPHPLECAYRLECVPFGNPCREIPCSPASIAGRLGLQVNAWSRPSLAQKAVPASNQPTQKSKSNHCLTPKEEQFRARYTDSKTVPTIPLALQWVSLS
jgi:hypothetical protein